MQGLAVTINSVDYTSYMQGFSIIWPCTQAVPTATITLDNTSGTFINLPLKSAVSIVVNGTYIFNGVTENYPYTLDKSMGHRVAIDCKSCYELTTLVEGSLNVVGTNLQVPIFGDYGTALSSNLTTALISGNAYTALAVTATNQSLPSGRNILINSGGSSQVVTLSSSITTGDTSISVTSFTANYSYPIGANVGTQYIPYSSVWAGSTLNAQLMDIGDVFKGLIHDPQPGQTAGYRGRLGYDVTNRGIATGSFDINTTGVSTPPNLNGFELGLYVKGMWYVGPGSTGTTSATSGSGANLTSLAGSGREAFGIDLLKALCQGNIVDTSGNPQFVDWYYDPLNNYITYFQRGSRSSGVTFTVGTDQIQAVNLPVDITDVKNDLVLWFNAESAYPASQDDWSNYAGTVLAQTTTTGTSNSGQKVLTVTATTGFVVGQSVNIRDGTVTAETCTIFSIQVGVSLTMTQNLVYTHAGAQTVKTYDITANWIETLNSGPGGGTLTTDSTNTYLGYGWSNKYAASAASSAWSVISDFTLAPTYQNLSPIDSLGNTRGISSFNFAYMCNIAPNANSLVIKLYDVSGSNSISLTPLLGSNPNQWYQAGPTGGTPAIVYPASGTPPLSGWTVNAGAWNFGTTTIGKIEFTVSLISNNPAPIFWIDQLYFGDNYYYSPVYNNFGPTFTNGSNITYSTNSINAYGDRIYNWNDYYTSGNSDAAQGIAQNLLTSRRGKHAYGSMSVYNPPLGSIFPGYLINITDSKDTYVGSTADSTITAWFVEQIEYDYDMNNGFIGTYTVEPYYATFNGTNPPDTNARDPWSQYRKNPSYQRAYMNTKTRFTTSY